MGNGKKKKPEILKSGMKEGKTPNDLIEIRTPVCEITDPGWNLQFLKRNKVLKLTEKEIEDLYRGKTRGWINNQSISNIEKPRSRWFH